MNPFPLPAFVSHHRSLDRAASLASCDVGARLHCACSDQVYDCVCGPCVSNSVLNRTLASHNAVAQCACQQVNGGFALL